MHFVVSDMTKEHDDDVCKTLNILLVERERIFCWAMSSLFLADGGLSSMNNEGLLLVHIYICSTIKGSLSAQARS